MPDDSFLADPYPSGFLHTLGQIIALWSNIEDDAASALYHLVQPADADPIRLQIVINHMALRDRLDALKAVCCYSMPEDDFLICERWINHIAGDLRNYRNRLIHDEWGGPAFNATSALRISLRTKIQRDKGSGDIRLHLASHTVVSQAELLAFVQDLLDARAALIEIIGYSKETGFQKPPPPLASRHKSHRPALKADRVHRNKMRKRGAPPQSSEG
jgi:hypothetical protein